MEQQIAEQGGIDSLRRAVGHEMYSYDFVQEIAIDGYVVGYIPSRFITFRDSKYRVAGYSVVGQDESGSKSWYYSDDYLNAVNQRAADDGIAGWMTPVTAGSIQDKFVRKRYAHCQIEVLTSEQVFSELVDYPTNTQYIVVTFPEN